MRACCKGGDRHRHRMPGVAIVSCRISAFLPVHARRCCKSHPFAGNRIRTQNLLEREMRSLQTLVAVPRSLFSAAAGRFWFWFFIVLTVISSNISRPTSARSSANMSFALFDLVNTIAVRFAGRPTRRPNNRLKWLALFAPQIRIARVFPFSDAADAPLASALASKQSALIYRK